MSIGQGSGCVGCGGILTGRQKKWDSAACQKREGRRKWIEKVYGISLEEYDLILEEQNGNCGCCGKPFREGQTPHIDHEHGGPVRGIVHPYCNTRLIGRLKDHELAQRLADYLLNPPAVRAIGVRIAPGRPRKKRQPRKRKRQ